MCMRLEHQTVLLIIVHECGVRVSNDETDGRTDTIQTQQSQLTQ